MSPLANGTPSRARGLHQDTAYAEGSVLDAADDPTVVALDAHSSSDGAGGDDASRLPGTAALGRRRLEHVARGAKKRRPPTFVRDSSRSGLSTRLLGGRPGYDLYRYRRAPNAANAAGPVGEEFAERARCALPGRRPIASSPRRCSFAAAPCGTAAPSTKA